MDIVLLRLDRIGDFILGIPAYRAVRHAYPDSRITMVVPSDVVELAGACPYVDEVYVHDATWLTHGGRPLDWWKSAWKLIRFLRGKKVDWVLNFRYQNRLDPLVAGLSGGRRRTGYDVGLASRFLTEKIEHPGPELHQVDRKLRLLESAGVRAGSRDLEIWWSESDETALDHVPDREALAGAIALHVGASTPAKRWPHERFTMLIGALGDLTPSTILLLGGESDLAFARQVLDDVHHPIINLAGQLSLRQMAAVVRQCRLFIGCDSGATHLAAAIGVPVVSLFSAANRVEVWRPWGPNVTVVTRHPACSPCHSFACTRTDGYFCMADITVEDVVAEVRKLLG